MTSLNFKLRIPVTYIRLAALITDLALAKHLATTSSALDFLIKRVKSIGDLDNLASLKIKESIPFTHLM